MVRIGAFFFSAIMMLISASVMASGKPNIIVMVADDLGWADVGFHGNQVLKHPRSIGLPLRVRNSIVSIPHRSARRPVRPL